MNDREAQPNPRDWMRDRAIADLRGEGFDVTEWHDDPDASYDEHAHPFREVRIILAGAITFIVDGQEITLGPGDRLDLEPMQSHSAMVGPQGVHYIAGTGR